jgi:hypothetical protein
MSSLILRALVHSTIRNYTETVAGLVVPSLVGELVHDVELRNAFLRAFPGPRRAACVRGLERAIDSGLLPPDIDVDLVMDIWGGTIFYRVLLTNIEAEDPEWLTDQLLQMILSAPPRKSATNQAARSEVTHLGGPHER